MMNPVDIPTVIGTITGFYLLSEFLIKLVPYITNIPIYFMKLMNGS